MFSNKESHVADYDIAVLQAAIRSIIGRRNITLQVFAESVETGEEHWTVNKLNHLFANAQRFTAQDRSDILRAIQRWNPERHIFNQTINDLLGFSTQLSLFMLAIVSTINFILTIA